MYMYFFYNAVLCRKLRKLLNIYLFSVYYKDYLSDEFTKTFFILVCMKIPNIQITKRLKHFFLYKLTWRKFIYFFNFKSDFYDFSPSVQILSSYQEFWVSKGIKPLIVNIIYVLHFKRCNTKM